MNKLILRNYNGFEIQFENVNGTIMANATLMAKAHGKRPDTWLRTEKAKEYIKAIALKSVLAENELVVVRNGGNGAGTWIHEKLILRFAQFLSTEFELWCDEKIAELLRTGKAELKPMSMEEMMIHQLQARIQDRKDIDELKQEVLIIKAKQETSPSDHFAVSGFAALKKIKIDRVTALKIAKKASALCKELGYIMGSVPDSRYGAVKTYPIDALEMIFKEMNLI